MTVVAGNLVSSLVEVLGISLLFVCGNLDNDSDLDMGSGFGGLNRRKILPSEALDVISKDSICVSTRSCLFVCDGLAKLLQQATTKEVTLDEGKVVLVHETATDEEFSALPLRLDSMLLSYNESEGLGTLVKEWYALPGKIGDIVSQDLMLLPFNWTGTMTAIPHLWERRRNLLGTVLRVAITPASSHPGNVLQEDGTYSGLGITVVDDMAQATNFTTSFVVPSDRKWGSQDANGTWNGIIKMLLDEDSDIIGPLAMTAERSSAIGYCQPSHRGLLTLIMKDDNMDKPSVNFLVYLTVFEAGAWCVTVAALILSGVVFSLMYKARCGIGMPGIAQPLDVGFFGVFMSLIQQSSDTFTDLCQRRSPCLLPTRMAFLTANVATFLLFVMYCSDLTATMTAGVPQASLNSFKDLYDQGYTMVYAKYTAEQAFLAGGKEDSFQMKMYNKRSTGLSTQADVEKALLDNSRHVTFGYDQLYLSHFKGQSYPLKPNLKFRGSFSSYGGLGLPIDSPLLELFKYHMVRLYQFGIAEQHGNIWFRGRSPPDRSNRIFSGEAFALGYSNLIFPVLILAGGVLISFAILFVEYFLPR